jgi:hypothetical protein
MLWAAVAVEAEVLHHKMVLQVLQLLWVVAVVVIFLVEAYQDKATMVEKVGLVAAVRPQIVLAVVVVQAPVVQIAHMDLGASVELELLLLFQVL